MHTNPSAILGLKHPVLKFLIQNLYGFWNFLKRYGIDHSICPGTFWKKRFFRKDMEKFWTLVWQISRIS